MVERAYGNLTKTWPFIQSTGPSRRVKLYRVSFYYYTGEAPLEFKFHECYWSPVSFHFQATRRPMALILPGGFVDLYTASTRNNVEVNIMGVVIDVLPPAKSRGPDWVVTFSITDSTMVNYERGLKVRFFKPMESELPKIQGIGDVIVLRSVKINQWSGMTTAISSYATSWTVFPESSIPEKALSRLQLKYINQSHGPPPLPSEMQYAIELCNSQDRSSYIKALTVSSEISDISGIQEAPSNQVKTIITRREKFCLVKDVQVDNFYDLVGQVVKIYSSVGCVELYITDYTSNSKLFNYQMSSPVEDDRGGDKFGYIDRNHTSRQWPGPFGKLTLTITLWPPHSYFAQAEIKEKDFVFLRNVRIKNSQDFKIEGSMHTDNRYEERIDINLIKDHRDDDRVKNILRRKLEYIEKSKAQSGSFIDQARLPKRKQELEKPLSKGQKKKRRQQSERNSKSNPENIENTSQHQNSNTDTLPSAKSNKLDLNKNGTFPYHSRRPLRRRHRL